MRFLIFMHGIADTTLLWFLETTVVLIKMRPHYTDHMLIAED